MAIDLEEELSVVPGVDELVLGRATEGNAAQYEWPGIVGKLLIALVAFFSDNGDRFEITKSEFRNAQRWQRGSNRREGRTAVLAGIKRPTPQVETEGVPKVFQKSKELGLKGLLIERKQIPGIGVSGWRIWHGVE